MRSVVAREDAATWVAEEGGAMAGFAIVLWEEARNAIVAYIETLEVKPELRGKGVGGELLLRCEESATVAGAGLIWLHVDAENEAAIGLYIGHGFERQRRVERYYPQGRAAEVYVKRLAAD